MTPAQIRFWATELRKWRKRKNICSLLAYSFMAGGGAVFADSIRHWDRSGAFCGIIIGSGWVLIGSIFYYQIVGQICKPAIRLIVRGQEEFIRAEKDPENAAFYLGHYLRPK